MKSKTSVVGNMIITDDPKGIDIPLVCPHQFFKIADETKKEGEQIQITVRWGVKIMCALCGQRRILWTDGEVEIL